MDSVGLIVMLIAIGGTAIEGGSCLISERRPLSVGIIDLWLCCLISFFTYFLCSGAIVIAPEFGAIMIQDSAALWFFRFALVSIAALPTLCWYRVAQLNENPVRISIYICLGILVGLWSATRLFLLHPLDIESLRVTVYDVWWPPLVLWLVFCLANIMLELAQNKNKTARFALAAALAAPMARFALARQDLSDPQSHRLWAIAEPVCLIAAVVLAVRSGKFARLSRRWKIVTYSVLILFSIVVLAVFVVGGYGTKLTIDLFLPVILVATLVVQICVRIREAGNIEPGQQPATADPAQLKLWLQTVSSEQLSGIVFAISVLIIPICIIDLLSIGFLDRNLEFGILTFFWLAFSARLAAGVFHTLPRIFKNGALYLPVLKTAWDFTANKLGVLGRAGANAAKSFSAGTKWAVAFRAVALTLFSILALIAVGEMLNYGKLVVEPFEWQGGDKDEQKVSDRVSAGVVNALGEMRRELLPVLLIGSPSEKGNARVQAAILDDGALAGAIAKGSDLKLTNVDIPLPLLTSPIQRLVQWLFNIRVVRGTLHKTAEGKHYLTLIESDRGDTWRVYGEIQATSTTEPAKPSDTTKQAPVSAVESNLGAGQPSAESTTCEIQAPGDKLDELIDEVAFRVASADPSFISLGLTSNWKSYKFFRAGLERWNCYQAYRHWSDLEIAIDSFRKAVREDPTFAPALYRLGVAFQSSGQPDSAIQAFKDALAANPAMIVARVQEAQTLSSYLDYYLSLPAIANSPPARDRSDEARGVWAEVLRQSSGPANRLYVLSAYYRLCTDGYGETEQGYSYTGKYYLRYFFCSRALATYYRLPRNGRNEPEQQKIGASILLWLGTALNEHDSEPRPFPPPSVSSSSGSPSNEDQSVSQAPPWNCFMSFAPAAPKVSQAFSTVNGSKYTQNALKYYRASLAIVPDNEDARCREASAIAFLAEDPDQAITAMAKLQSSASAHVYLAQQLADQARLIAQGRSGLDAKDNPPAIAAEYYQRSLEEYDEALVRSPSDPDALNEYGTTIWRWWLDAKSGSAGAITRQPDYLHHNPDYLHKSEGRAREAVRLSQLRHDQEMESAVTDTLGEILIALGRNEEAVDVLTKVTRASDFPGADEIRWDLAQASVCASKKSGKDEQESISRAESEIEEIREHELNREARPFTLTRGALNQQMAQERCATPPDEEVMGKTTFAFDGVTHRNQPGCSTMVRVNALVTGKKPQDTALLLWGEGAGDGDRPENLSIEVMPPSHVHRMYFAQLVQVTDYENNNFTALSPVITFDMPKDPSCGYGNIILNFKSSTREGGETTPARLATN